MDKQQALDQLRLMQAWHEDFGNGPNADYDAICYAINIIEAQPKELDTLIKALEKEHQRLLEMQKVQPHTYRGVTLNDVMMYFDSLEGNEDAWTEFCSCFECRGWGLHRIQDGDARQDFMDIVYSELASDPDNNRANRIIWAADGYAESAQLGTNLAEVGTDMISRQVAIADAQGGKK